MYRNAMSDLIRWKEKQNKKPLIIQGARQVGKTWLMKKFGETYYDNMVYINFDNNNQMTSLFDSDYDVERIINGIEIYANQKIDTGNTLLIFDEVQEVPKVISSLKYFHEEAPAYQIICAGSLLGVSIHEGLSFPVGKVEFLNLYPFSFSEFIRAMGEDALADLVDADDFDMANTFSLKYIELLKNYYYVGGMPEVVSMFSENADYDEVRILQQQILMGYEQDFSKHAPSNIVPRIRLLWHSIPSQLAKENKKFIYGLVKKGARAREYEIAMSWLIDCGLVYKVNRISEPSLPLMSYEDLKAFKLYILDVGLLSCMTELHSSVLLDGNRLFKEFKGAFTETYVLSQLVSSNKLKPYYWTNSNGTAEVDFVVGKGQDVVPIEVKAERNLKAKSLKVYYEKYKPKKVIRTAMTKYSVEEWLVNLPLWLVESL